MRLLRRKVLSTFLRLFIPSPHHFALHLVCSDPCQLSMQTGGPFTISATLVPAAVVQPGPPPPPSRPPSRSNQIPPPPPPGSQGQGQMPDVLRLSRRDSHNSLSDRSSTPQTPVLGYDHGNRFCVSGNGNVLNIASLNIGNGPNHSSTTLPGFLPGGHGGELIE